MSRAGGKRRAARRWYLSHPPKDAVLGNEDQPRTGAGDPSPKPVPATPSASDVAPIAGAPDADANVLRVVNFNTEEERQRRAAEGREVMLMTLGRTSPYV